MVSGGRHNSQTGHRSEGHADEVHLSRLRISLRGKLGTFGMTRFGLIRSY